jgi:hypothetical protein
MRYKFTFLILHICFIVLVAQNNSPLLLGKARYKEYKGKDNSGLFYFEPPVNYSSILIADDYGPRILLPKIFDWHSGIDYNGANNANGQTDKGDLVLSVSNGEVQEYGINTSNKLRWICIKDTYNTGNSTNPTDIRYFYYEHIFSDFAGVGTNIDGVEIKFMNPPNTSKWAIITKDCGNGHILPCYKAIGPVIGTISFIDEIGILQTINVLDNVYADDAIASVGGSGGFAGKEHNHIQILTKYVDGKSLPYGPGDGADPWGKNALEYIAYDKPDYDIVVKDENNSINNVNIQYPGTNQTKIRVIPAIRNMPLNPTTTDKNFKRYDKVYDVNKVKIEVKPKLFSSSSFGYIHGNERFSLLSLGASKNSSIYNTDYNYCKAQGNCIGIGNWNQTGVNPFAYSGVPNSSHPYDEFYFTDFVTRINKNANINIKSKQGLVADNPQSARYNDGLYDLRTVIETISNQQIIGPITAPNVHKPISITLDNFMPFVRQAIIKFQNLGYNTYDREWKADEVDLANKNGDDGYVYKKSTNYCVPKSLLESDLGAINITAYASEELENLDLEIFGTTNGKVKGVLADPSKYEWKFTIQKYYKLNSSTNNNEFELRFTGKDKSGNDLLNMEEYQGLVIKNNTDFKKIEKVYIPKRQVASSTICSDCWSPILVPGWPKTEVDYFHRLSLNPDNCGKFVVGDNTANKSAVAECIKSVDDVTVNTKNSSGTNGSITLTFPANASGYAIRWLKDGVVLPQYNDLTTITNLASGLYCFEIVCECCKFGNCVEVPSCPSMLETATVEPTCTDGNSGSASITAANGTAPYTYAWSNGKSSPIIGGLAKGFYKVSITDAEGCQSVHDIEVKDKLEVKATVTPLCSDTDNGSIVLDVIDNTILFPNGPSSLDPEYNWEKQVNGNWTSISNEQNLTNITTAGKYKVTINYGTCIYVKEFEVKDSKMIVSYTVIPVKGAPGEANITVDVGVAPFSLVFSGNGVDVKDVIQDLGTPYNISQLNEGYYDLTISDAGGCIKKLKVYIYNCDDVPS